MGGFLKTEKEIRCPFCGLPVYIWIEEVPNGVDLNLYPNFPFYCGHFNVRASIKWDYEGKEG